MNKENTKTKIKKRIADIAKPLIIILLVVLTFTVMVGTDYVKIDKFWFIFPLTGIRISTVITAMASFALVLVLQRRNTIKSIYYALLAVIFSMGLFEVVWYFTAAFFREWDFRIFEFAALSGWIFLGIREVFRKRPPKISILLYVIFVILMSIWMADGFPFNDTSNVSFNIFAEFLNVASKAALFFAYALHIGSVK